MRCSAIVAATVPVVMTSAPRQVLFSPNRRQLIGRLSAGTRSQRRTGACARCAPNAGRKTQRADMTMLYRGALARLVAAGCRAGEHSAESGLSRLRARACAIGRRAAARIAKAGVD